MNLKKQEDESRIMPQTVTAALKGTAIGMAAALASVLIFCAVLLRFSDPMAAIGIFALAALYVGALATSLAASLLNRDNSISTSILGCALYCTLVFVASLFAKNGDSIITGWSTLTGYGGCALLSLFSGIISRPRAVMVRNGKKSPAAIARERHGRRHK